MLRVKANGIAIRVDDYQEDSAAMRRQLFSRISSLTTSIMPKLLSGAFDRDVAKDTVKELEEIVSIHVEGEGKTIQEYKDMFKFYKPDAVATLDQFASR